MAFDAAKMALIAHGLNRKIYAYASASDAMAAILGANYFDAFAAQVAVGDVVVIQDSADLVAIVRVSARTATSVTVSYVTGWAQQAAIASLTDSSGGSTDGTVEAVSGSSADAAINNNFAELHAKLDAVLTALRTVGVIASS